MTRVERQKAEDRRCGFCGKRLAERQGVGSGSIADGVYCNPDCFANAFPTRMAQAQRHAARRPN
jgi:hypothetical protein